MSISMPLAMQQNVCPKINEKEGKGKYKRNLVCF